MTVPILLVVASLAVFILEVFLVSFGALSVVAVGLGIAAVMLAFKQAALYGWIMIGVLFVGIPLVLRLAFKILPKLPFARGFYLRAPDLTEEERTAAAGSLSDLMGREGEATSQLRPAGTALFGDRPVPVQCKGSMIDPGTRVRVVEVSGNRVIVEKVDGSA